jgi:hypothetical protein
MADRRMRIPEDLGTTISMSGISVTADADRCVMVPEALVEQLKGHGLIDVVEEERQIAREEAQAAKEAARAKSDRPRIRKTATVT